MTVFDNRWSKSEKEPVASRLKSSIAPQQPMRDKIGVTQTSIQGLLNKLDSKTKQVREKDAVLFRQVVAALQKHDQERALAYSNELAEVRKVSNNLMQVKLVLEQIKLRLGTVQEFGDIISTLSPIVGVVRSIWRNMEGIMPEAGSELSEIGGMLNEIVTDAGQRGGFFANIEPSNEEAEKILAEASALAEQKMASKLPDLPSQGVSELSFTQ